MSEALNNTENTEEKPSLKGTWRADPVHSELSFKVRHMGIGKAGGIMPLKESVLEFPENDLKTGKVVSHIDASGVETKNEQRNAHIRSDDFLNVEKYPEILFRSTGVKNIDGESFTLEGDLTVRDVTKPVTLDAEFFGTIFDAAGVARAGFAATSVINRKDFGVKFGPLFGVGNAVVSDKVELTIEAEFIKD